MTIQDVRNVTVIGCGMIGPDISTAVLMAGLSVVLVGLDEADTARGIANVTRDLDDLVSEQILSPSEKADALGRIVTSVDLAGSVRDADIVLEAAYENLKVKQDIFRIVDANCKADALLCSSTSGLSPNAIGAGLVHQDQMMVTHFWNPPHLVPLVEIVPHDRLGTAARQLVMEFIQKLGKTAVILKKDIAGHIGNRLQHALYREALHLIEQGVADPEDIDKVVLFSFGPRFSAVGPMEFFDSCGLDLHRQVQSYLYPTLCVEPSPQRILLEKIQKGELGQKSGQGLFDWSKRDEDDFRYRRNKNFIQRLKQQRKDMQGRTS
jgi:3-hydroxybutyryl-CoA dehydrogenase